MEIIDTEIKDVKILKPQVFGDERGFFMETWRDSFFRENVADKAFVQDNHSKSTAHVLRGLHYQLSHPQGKLVRVVQGEVYDVAVDLYHDVARRLEVIGIEVGEARTGGMSLPVFVAVVEVVVDVGRTVTIVVGRNLPHVVAAVLA